MDVKEVGREFLTRVCDYLVSLPYDLKILQEAVSDPDLELGVREIAAGVLIHGLNHQEGTGAERFFEDVFLVRIALDRVATQGGDGAEAFRKRFLDEVYGKLADDLRIFQEQLGPELWHWLSTRPDTFSRLTLKGKRPPQYVDDQEALDILYETGVDFQTNFNVTETQVKNKLRRCEQITDLLQKRQAEDLKKRA